MGLLHYTKNIFIKSITQVFINELADPSFYHILSYIVFYLCQFKRLVMFQYVKSHLVSK